MQGTLISTYFLPAVLAIIMFNLGLSLRISDFKRILEHPRQLIIGLSAQIIILPLIAFGIASISSLSNEMKVGIMIIAACPGGAVSNLITYYLKGSVSLSVSLTTVNSVVILGSLPAIIWIAMSQFLGESEIITMSIQETVLKIFAMILIPTSLGMLLRHKRRLTAYKIEQVMKYLSVILLAVVYSFVIFEKNGGQRTSIVEYLEIAPWVFALNILGMLTGFWMARFTGLNIAKQITLSVEVGIQNSALAITIASSAAFLGNHQMALPAVVYGMFTFFSAVIFGLIIRKWVKPTKIVKSEPET
ncbi:MAG: bile acid:sodium symporter family protein [Bacteroidales bacterium]|jgi:BASS family bile acid:Na+ symporter|nr:bile acid:sodium symporter family protein [Bacteroidales bacterium]